MRIYRPGTVNTTFYVKNSTTAACTGPNTPTGYNFAGLGTEIPPTDFVEMMATTSTQ